VLLTRIGSGGVFPVCESPFAAIRYEPRDWGMLDLDQPRRVVVLTDFGNEPDDAQSLVRFLVYSNEFDVEGILATTSTWLRDAVHVEGVRAHIDVYARVRDNLLAHAPGYPSVDALHERVHPCQALYGMQGIGPGMDSDGSNHLLRVMDESDERTIWISIWGAARTVSRKRFGN